MKELVCPHCKKTVQINGGFRHDAEQNMICNLCDGVLFATNKELENKNRTALSGSPQAGLATWQKKECLPIRLDNKPPTNSCPTTRSEECLG